MLAQGNALGNRAKFRIPSTQRSRPHRFTAGVGRPFSRERRSFKRIVVGCDLIFTGFDSPNGFSFAAAPAGRGAPDGAEPGREKVPGRSECSFPAGRLPGFPDEFRKRHEAVLLGLIAVHQQYSIIAHDKLNLPVVDILNRLKYCRQWSISKRNSDRCRRWIFCLLEVGMELNWDLIFVEYIRAPLRERLIGGVD